MLKAAIDLGTNSFLLVIAELDEGRLGQIHEDQVRIVRLGEKVNSTGEFQPQAIERAMHTLVEYRDICGQYGLSASEVRAVGTCAMREARNGREFVHRVRSELGFEIEIISGDDEARLGWAGSLCDLDLPTDAAPYTVDIGGGSTELAWDSGHQRVSLPLGCVRFLEHHITSDPPSPDDLNAMRCDIATNLRKVSPLNTIAPLIAVGGTATTLLAIAKGISPYDPQQIHGHTMSLATLQNVLGQLSAVPLQQRKQIRGLEPERADVIIPGAIILITICEYLNQQSMIVSDRGLRYGLLLTT